MGLTKGHARSLDHGSHVAKPHVVSTSPHLSRASLPHTSKSPTKA